MPSIIGTDLKIVGNLVCEGDIDIQGAVQGDIDARSVTVDKDARVDGSIQAQSLIVSGTVEGGMEASSISLTSTATVTGEIIHETLSVDPGANLEARLSRISKEKRIAAQIPKPQLKTAEAERPAAESSEDKPAAAEAAQDKRAAPATAEEKPLAADSDEADAPDSGASKIPEVFDRRKKQATG